MLQRSMNVRRTTGNLIGRGWARRRPRGEVRLNLALQGGGAHGAFTWGVLDRLLETGRTRHPGISGTSAGAVNAVVLASGLLAGGRDGARTALAALWEGVALAARPLRRLPIAHSALDLTAQIASPYQLNPLNRNPLRDLLDGLVDFDRIRRDGSLKLFIAATNLRTGGLRIFENGELTVEAVLASACLPTLHHAVEIDGEAYWDGGYVSNPPLLPLIAGSEVRDTLLVRINPTARDHLPTSAPGIRSRVGEIVFDQPLTRELALLEAHRRRWPGFARGSRRLARHRLEVIDGGPGLARLDGATRIYPDRPTLHLLRDEGRAAARRWLERRGTAGRPG